MNDNLQAGKRRLRLAVKQAKQALSPAEMLGEAACVRRLIESLPVWQQAGTILLYHSMSDELPTIEMIAEWQRLGKRIVLPRVVDDGLELADAASGMAQAGRYRILEPCGPALEPDTIDLAIIPAIAVDKAGNRLGRGGGYYDRLLPQLRCATIAAVLSCQLVDKVPTDNHYDMGVDYVVTQSGLIQTKSQQHV